MGQVTAQHLTTLGTGDILGDKDNPPGSESPLLTPLPTPSTLSPLETNGRDCLTSPPPTQVPIVSRMQEADGPTTPHIEMNAHYEIHVKDLIITHTGIKAALIVVNTITDNPCVGMTTEFCVLPVIGMDIKADYVIPIEHRKMAKKKLPPSHHYLKTI